jgi:hypothetical protein
MIHHCNDLQPILKSFSLVQSCEIIQNGMLRIQTPFQYMDGSKIDLFIGSNDNLFKPIVISDMGETLATLNDVQVKPWSTKKRKDMVTEICRSLDVEQTGGEFCINLRPDQLNEIPMAIVRLSQACIRIADIALSQRNRMMGQFKEELEEAIALADLEYESSVAIEGRFGKPIDIDFRVKGTKIITLVQTLSTANTAASHQLSNEVFRKWYDLENVRNQYQFLTIYDSSTDVFRPDDLARIEAVSTTLAFPAQQELMIPTMAA